VSTDDVRSTTEGELTHLDSDGHARLEPSGARPRDARRAVAEATVVMSRSAARTLADEGGPRGDVGGIARTAGILAAKRTSETIPLRRPILLDAVGVELAVNPDAGVVTIRATVEADGVTGIETEAMTAASVAALVVYDLVRGVDHGVVVERVRLVESSHRPRRV
jgi:cyclic pyranopterin phosphate synthase